jgi:hypothetical protein
MVIIVVRVEWLSHKVQSGDSQDWMGNYSRQNVPVDMVAYTSMSKDIWIESNILERNK